MALVPAYGARPLQYSKLNGATVRNVVPYQPAYTATGNFPKATGDKLWKFVNGLWLFNSSATMLLDSSTSSVNLTNSGSVTWNGLVPSIGGGSVVFNGSDALYNSSTAAYEYSGGWCFESYVAITSSQIINNFFLNTNGTGQPGDILLGFNSSSKPSVQVGAIFGIQSATPIPADGVFRHYAVCSNGSLITLYVNGISVGTYSYSTPLTIAGINLGSLSNLGAGIIGLQGPTRITGAQRYSGPFTPPTSFPTHG